MTLENWPVIAGLLGVNLATILGYIIAFVRSWTLINLEMEAGKSRDADLKALFENLEKANQQRFEQLEGDLDKVKDILQVSILGINDKIGVLANSTTEIKTNIEWIKKALEKQ